MSVAGLSSIPKISALIILGLILCFTLPATATPKLFLTTILHTQQLPTVKFDSPVLVSSPFLYLSNFTLDLTGRDPGSTIVKLTIVNPTNLVAILSSSNLTAILALRPPVCQTSCPPVVTGLIELSYDVAASTPFPAGGLATLSFRPPASGTYHLAFFTSSTIIYLGEIRGYETWTTTTIA